MELSIHGLDDVASQVYQLFSSYSTLNRATKWQGVDLSNKPYNKMHDVHGVNLKITCFNWSDLNPDKLASSIVADMPWAEEHFQERINGRPMNPQPSESRWPYGDGSNAKFKEGDIHSHTYSERFWPNNVYGRSLTGIRYAYGDLMDVISSLIADPGSRQAVLPIWFPEDTLSNGVRKPCSLFYHFLPQGDRLSLHYSIRSCDLYRHFKNDVYFALRLLQFVVKQLAAAGLHFKPSYFMMNIGSLHLFDADRCKVPQLDQLLRSKGK